MRHVGNSGFLLILLVACLGLAPEPVTARSVSSTAAQRVALAADGPPGSLPGLRIGIRDRGMVRLTYEAIAAAGAGVDGLDPARFALWHLADAVALEVTGGDDGRLGPGDALVFYGEPATGRYATENVYRLTWSGGPGVRIAERDASPTAGQAAATSIRQRTRLEYNRVYYSAYRDLPRDADHLFDNPLYPNSVLPTVATTYTLDLPNLASGGDAVLTVSVHGGRALADRDPDQSLALRLNGIELGQNAWDGSVTHLVTETVSASQLAPAGNKLVLQAALGAAPRHRLLLDFPRLGGGLVSRACARSERSPVRRGSRGARRTGAAALFAAGARCGGSGTGPGR